MEENNTKENEFNRSEDEKLTILQLKAQQAELQMLVAKNKQSIKLIYVLAVVIAFIGFIILFLNFVFGCKCVPQYIQIVLLILGALNVIVSLFFTLYQIFGNTPRVKKP